MSEPRLILFQFVVKVPKGNFRYYEGRNSSAVKKEYDGSQWFSFSPWKPASFRLNLYNLSCIGLESPETYRIYLKIRCNIAYLLWH